MSASHESIEREQIARLERYRRERDANLVERRLHEVREGAAGSANLMVLFVEAVDAGATIGEICDVLRAAFGRYVPAEVGA